MTNYIALMGSNVGNGGWKSRYGSAAASRPQFHGFSRNSGLDVKVEWKTNKCMFACMISRLRRKKGLWLNKERLWRSVSVSKLWVSGHLTLVLSCLLLPWEWGFLSEDTFSAMVYWGSFQYHLLEIWRMTSLSSTEMHKMHNRSCSKQRSVHPAPHPDDI